jgi:tetratricopeptide (TPR) repeat protein
MKFKTVKTIKLLIFTMISLAVFLSAAEHCMFAPVYASDLNNEAVELFKRNQIEKALDKMYRAINAEPHNVEYRYNLALMLYKAGNRFVEAKKACEDVLTLDHENARAKALLKGCIEKILQGDGVRTDTSLAVSKFLEAKKQVHVKVSDVPEELKQFLKMLYLDRNFDEAYIYFSAACKKAITAADYSAHMEKTLNEELTGTARDVKINGIRFKEKEGYGVAIFEVVYEKELKQPLKTALGGYNTVLEKKKNFMFFVKEEDKWSVIPPDFIVDKFIYYCSQYPDVLSYTGTEMQFEQDWVDSALIECEKMGEFLQNKKPEEALKLRIMYSAMAFIKARKDKNYSQMYDMMAAMQYKLTGNKMKFIKSMTQKDLKVVIRDVKIIDVVIKSRIASVKYSIEMFNNAGSESLSVNKLVTYLMIVKDGIDWKVCDLWRGKWFLEKFPMLYKEFNPGDDQYLEFNGRDWIDRSIEYNAVKREEMMESENRL